MNNGNGVVMATPQERLQQRLNNPETTEALIKLLDKMDVILLTVESVDGFLSRGDQIIENISDSMHDVRKMAPTTDIDVEKTASVMSESLPVLLDALPRLTHALPRLLALAEKLDDPDTAEALDQIIGKMELVAMTLESADGFLKRSDTVIENVADSVNDIRKMAPANEMNLIGTLLQTLPQLAETLPQLVTLLPSLTRVIPQLQAVLDSDEFEALMTSGVFSPKTVGIVSEAGNSLVDSYEASQTRPQTVGLFGLLRAMQDPDVQRAMGFFMDFSKRFGRSIK
ncbi:MAG: DUF1641 domain-containing protein [Anaerolineae bacterium]|nr:DUF1641 domain-containing protein [Anaerolineae bacterium]